MGSKLASFLAAAVVLPAAAFAGPSPDLVDLNLDWLRTHAPHVADAGARAVAAFLGQRGVALPDLFEGGHGEAAGMGGAHVGEAWHLCYDVFFAGPTCELTTNIEQPLPRPCTLGPPGTLFHQVRLQVAYDNGPGGDVVVDQFVTEYYLGLAPQYVYPRSVSHFQGSGCVVWNDPDLVLTTGFGVTRYD